MKNGKEKELKKNGKAPKIEGGEPPKKKESGVHRVGVLALSHPDWNVEKVGEKVKAEGFKLSEATLRWEYSSVRRHRALMESLGFLKR